jgi:5-methylcytosine-specific restriction endonuclease McrA
VLTEEECREAQVAKRREAQLAAHRRWYAANREAVAKRNAAWRKANREHIAKQVAAWQKANPAKCAEYSAKWRAVHPNIHSNRVGRLTDEEVKSRDREKAARRRELHPEETKAANRAYYRQNADRLNAARSAWDQDNHEKSIETHRVWRLAHPAASVLMDAKRRAAKCANTPIEDMLTSTEWLAILAQADGHCAYCGKEARLTLDHVISLSKGGKHSRDNVVPACGHCNSSKGNKTLEEWNAKRLKQLTN